MMNVRQVLLFLLRLALGWLFFWAGITKVLNPDWTAAGFLNNAKTFAGLYHALAQPGIITVVNWLNEWGLLLLGLALLGGIFIRLAGILGAILMLLYYFPGLEFPYVGKTALLVDEHIVYALALLALGSFRAGRVWGLALWCAKLPWCSRYPRLRAWLD